MNRKSTSKILVFFLMIVGILILPTACEDEGQDGLQIENELGIEYSRLPYANLSDYGFFQGSLSELSPVDRVLPYDLNTPLFSDYASKARFVWMPEGQAANYSQNETLDFPLGTVIIKNFYFQNDMTDDSQGRRIIETRLLVRQDTNWQPISYVWNTSQTDASLDIAGADIPVSWIHYDGSSRNTYYHIPNKNECKGCHSTDNKLLPLGPRTRNLNKDYDFADGSMNQLTKWQQMGYLTGAPTPDSAPRSAVYDDPDNYSLEARARAYLDVNCAHCHNPKGPAKNSGLYLDISETDPYALGVCKAPVATGGGSGPHEYAIVPGEPENSIMYYRMNSTELDVAMPELARSVIHEEGLALIYDWIDNLPGDCE